MLPLLVLYSLLFFILAWKNFRGALYVFIISLPSYLIRFNLGPLPSTLLELEFAIIFVVWLIKFSHSDWPGLKTLTTRQRLFFILYSLFFIASIFGILISDQWYISLGQWRAYFLEPMLFFIILLGRREQFTSQGIAKALVLSAISISVIAIIQATTGQLYPPSLWNDIVAGRATAFFTSPNAVGLYLGPCFLLALGLLLESRQAHPQKNWWFELLTTVILFGLIASQSVGALVAAAIATLLLAIWCGDKKLIIALASAVVFVAVGLGTVLLAVPSARALLATKLHSGNNRLVLWQYSEQFFTQNPKNFIFGAGIRQFFRKIQKPHYNGKELERLIYPHNFFLNFWSETGLLGMFSVSFLVGWLLFRLYQKIRSEKTFLAVSIFCALVALLLHGLIDVPYFKNDLAMLFWALVATALTASLPRGVGSAPAEKN